MINFKSIGIKAAAIIGAVASIWLAVRPEGKSESSDLLTDLPELDDEPAEEAAEETETTDETEETGEPTEEETKEA